MSNLKISVITVCLNAQDSIKNTIASVLSQDYMPLELIIIDGGSTDETLKIVGSFGARVDQLISEKDNGIYDAMNKGIGKATGDIVYFLNSGDRLCDPTVFSQVAKTFELDSKRSVIYGRICPVNVPEDFQKFVDDARIIQSKKDFLYYTICHQAMFAKRSLFAQIGKFDCRYKYCADYDWQIRAYISDPKGFYFLNKNICYYHFTGLSFLNWRKTKQENSLIRFKYLFSLTFLWRYVRYDVVRGFKKKILNEKY